ncbi:MAG: toll/interleukin-1 receptor domain-containing protein [Chloroflexi bacterium]|nr:toll/interleukin-1 receptor domain-containing protein [Chloroflexota bacterium]
MATKVFISWSGDLSRKLGEALRNWLPATLQYVKPYFSPDDIEKGAKWNSEIAKELETSNVGVICLTQDNTEKPWILFESGALSKTLDKARVCTLLFNLDAADVKGPLTSFQATRFVREDFKRLVSTINNTAGDGKLENSVLESVFDMWWPRLEEQVAEILKTHDKGTKRERRPERDILEEILDLTRMNAERAHRPSRISARAVLEVVENLNELLFIVAREHGDMGVSMMERIDRPVRHLCIEAAIPEVYERFHVRMLEMAPVNRAARDRAAEQEPGADASKPRRSAS